MHALFAEILQAHHVAPQPSTTCPACGGRGRLADHPCRACDGTGRFEIASAMKTLVLCDCHASPGDPRPDPLCPACHGTGEVEVTP